MAESENKRNRQAAQSFGIAPVPLVGGVFRTPMTPAVAARMQDTYGASAQAFTPYVDPYAATAQAYQLQQFDQGIQAQQQENTALNAMSRLWAEPESTRTGGLQRILGQNPLAASSPAIQAYMDAQKDLRETQQRAAADPYIRSIQSPVARQFYQQQIASGLSPDEAYTATQFNEQEVQLGESLRQRGIDPASVTKAGRIDKTLAERAVTEQEKILPTKPRVERLSPTVNKRIDEKLLPEVEAALAEQANEYGPYQARIEAFSSGQVGSLTKPEQDELSQNPPFDATGNLTPYWSNKIDTDRTAKVNSRLAPSLRALNRSGMAPGEISREIGIPLDQVQQMLTAPARSVAGDGAQADAPQEAPAAAVAAAPSENAIPGIQTATEARNAQERAVAKENRDKGNAEASASWQAAKIDALARLQRLIGGNGVPPQPGFEGLTMPQLLAEIARGNKAEIAQAAGMAQLSDSLDEAGLDSPVRDLEFTAAPISRTGGARDSVSWEEVIDSLVGLEGNNSRDLLARYGITPEQLHSTEAPSLPTVKTVADVEKLKSGDRFIDPNGIIRQKP